MRRRLIMVGVVAFWLVMMATLVRRHLRQARLERLPGTWGAVLTRARRNYQERMGIWWHDKRVGHSHTVFLYKEDASHVIDNHTELTVAIPSLLPTRTTFKLHTEVTVGADHSLRGLHMSLEGPLLRGTCEGVVTDGKLVLHPWLDGKRQEPIELQLPPNAQISQAMSPLLALPRLRKGMRWAVTVVDPFTLAPAKVTLEVLRREVLEWQGQRVDTYVVKIDSGMWMRALAWVSLDGEVLKQRTLLGLTFIKEPVPDDKPAGATTRS